MYRVSLITDPTDARYGTIVFDKPSYVTGDAVNTINVVVTKTPAGAPLAVADFASNTSSSVAIPVDADSKFQYGVYEVLFTEDGQTYVASAEFVCRDKADYPFTANEQCRLNRVELVDNGSYQPNATTKRVFRIRRSSVPVFNAAARDDSYSTFDQPTFKIAIGYAGVNYTFSITGETEWPVTSNVTYRHVFATRSITSLVSCDKTICEMARCVEEKVQSIRSVAAACGRALSLSDMDTISSIHSGFLELLARAECGDYKGVVDAYTALESLVGACDCGCADNVPRKLADSVAYTLPDDASISGGSTLIISTDNTGALDIEELIGERKITVSDLLLRLHDNAVTRTGDAVDVSLTPEAWTELSGASLSTTWSDWTNTGVAYRKLRSVGGIVQVRAALRTSVPPTPGTYNAITSALPVAYRPTTDTIHFPVVSETGLNMGTVKVTSAGLVQMTLSYTFPVDSPTASYDYFFDFTFAPEEEEVFVIANSIETI